METTQMSATGLLSIFETTKEQRQNFVNDIVQRIDEGMVSPLKIQLQIKCIEDITKKLKDNPQYKKNLLEEAAKNGKKFEYHNATFETKEAGVTYDYSNCKDQYLQDMLTEQIRLNDRVKERQEMLKHISTDGSEIIYQDEAIKIFPPVKSSTTTIAVSLK